MRARSIKPGICDNEILGTADPYYTLLFERLWLLADRDGRLEDRPLRIKAQAFPYGEGLPVDAMLQWLHDTGFIVRYEVNGHRFIQILNFFKHQRPHKNEQASVIPPMAEASTAKAVPAHDQGNDVDALTPSSLTPSSLTDVTPTPIQGSATRTGRKARTPKSSTKSMDDVAFEESFDRVRSSYPTFSGPQNWTGAAKAIRKLLKADITWDEIERGTHRYAAYVAAGGASGPQFVMQPKNFFGRDDWPWMHSWEPPPTKAEAKQQKNIDATQAWLAEESVGDGEQS